jgi:hypothetical protein
MMDVTMLDLTQSMVAENRLHVIETANLEERVKLIKDVIDNDETLRQGR